MTDETKAPEKKKAPDNGGSTKPEPKATYLVNARYVLPRFGGLPYPKGISLFGFVTFKLQEAKPGEGLTEKQALAAARREVKKQGHVPDGIVIEAVSTLHKNW